MKPRYFVFLCGAWILCVWLHMAFYLGFERGERREVTIPRGASVFQATRIIGQEGIASASLLRLFVLLSRQEKVIAGRYLIAPGTPIRKIATQLASGPPQEKVTFPEGFTSFQMAALLEEKGICQAEEYLALVARPELFRKPWLQDVRHLEGFLFPDTYAFSLPSSPQEVIGAQLERFEQVVLPLYEKSASSLSLREVVTLASIVEKEAGKREEKPYVASVFLNRLKKGMKLQSCATVVYAHYRERGVHRESLTHEDLEIDSPFNTYLHRGLPPQPIGNPGLDAVRACLYPEKTDYLYFVLREDGTHSFSTTYEEHLAKKEGNSEKTGK